MIKYLALKQKERILGTIQTTRIESNIKTYYYHY